MWQWILPLLLMLLLLLLSLLLLLYRGRKRGNLDPEGFHCIVGMRVWRGSHRWRHRVGGCRATHIVRKEGFRCGRRGVTGSVTVYWRELGFFFSSVFLCFSLSIVLFFCAFRFSPPFVSYCLSRAIIRIDWFFVLSFFGEHSLWFDFFFVALIIEYRLRIYLFFF